MLSPERPAPSDGPQLVSDCVHGMVLVPDYARKTVADPLVKRLGRIKQLGTLYHAWPSATHSRLEHSIGVMHLAEQYSQLLGFRSALRRTFGLASLLHDIGHGPFSHVFERAIKGTPSAATFQDHDHWRIRLLSDSVTLTQALHPDPHISVSEALKAPNTTTRDIIAIWSDKPSEAARLTSAEVHIAHALLAGVAGVDRLDYLLRDSYHTNPQHRIDRTAVQAIMHHTTVNYIAGTVTYTAKGQHYVRLLLDARSYMHREVYSHHRAVAADLAIIDAFRWGLETRTRDLLNVFGFERLTDSWVEQQAFDDDYLSYQLCPPSSMPPALNPLLRAIRGTAPRLTPCDPDDPAAITTVVIHGTTPEDLQHITNRWDIPDYTIAFRPAL